MISRRRFVRNASLGPLACGLAARFRPARAATGFSASLATEIADIEQASGGRLGVAVLDELAGAHSGHRVDERFPMCSTFKLLLASAILARVDAGREHLERRIRFAQRDLLAYAPITKERVGGGGMSVKELCEAALTWSDNTAANLLLAAIEGPAGVTAFARSLGDGVTRLDRFEPELNEAIPGDPRDTTAPAAMLADMRALLLGSILSAASRDQLTVWLIANKTGDARLRAGLPSGWRVGDKTGTGERGTANDVGIAWPPGRAPILVAAYLTESPKSDAERNAVLATVGRAIAAGL